MQDKQNKGIGAYQDRPGYFMGGLIGGAILGALVNKVQGKDWKRGALWGGVTGGLGQWAGSAMMPSRAAATAAKAPWWKKMLYSAGQKFKGNAPAIIGSGLGATGAWMAGDPGYDEEKWRQKKLEDEAKRRAEQTKAYKYWHTNPFATGGIATARPGYPGGGSATLEYTDPDLYTPTGEGRGPSSNPILQIPLGPEGSFSEEFDDLDMASASDPMDEWNQMYENYLLEGGAPMPLPDFIEMMLSEGDFTPDYGAQGGYKTRPKYAQAGPVDRELTERELLEQKLGMIRSHPLVQDHGSFMSIEESMKMTGMEEGSYDEIDQKADRMLDQLNKYYDAGATNMQEAYMMKTDEMLSNQGHPMGSRQDDLYNQLYRAQGGIADLDMTKGGASYGPGTGTSDDIPAMLSDGEFVVTANAVKNLGGGDRMKGARKMYSMMNQLDPDSQTPAEMSTVGMA